MMQWETWDNGCYIPERIFFVIFRFPSFLSSVFSLVSLVGSILRTVVFFLAVSVWVYVSYLICLIVVY